MVMSASQLIDFLIEQAARADQDAVRLQSSSRSLEAGQRLALMRKFTEASEAVRAMSEKNVAIVGDAPLMPSDLVGLPKELMDELNLSDADQLEIALLEIVEELGGAANLDRLLVAWYRNQGEVLKRRALTSRLHRMVTKGRLFSVPGRKGVYSIYQPQKGESDKAGPTNSVEASPWPDDEIGESDDELNA